MKDDLQNYMELPKRYENIDGTGEISMGLMLLGFALSSYLNTILPNNRWWNGMGGVLLMFAVLIPALALGYWGGKAIKKHITWPRTGYVAYCREGKSWWSRVVATLVVSAVLGAGFTCLMLFAGRQNAVNLPRIVFLAVIVATYGYWVFRMSREYPWKWLVLLFLALGLLAIALIVPGNVIELMRPASWFICLVWLGSGGATLYSYIRHTQPPTPATE